MVTIRPKPQPYNQRQTDRRTSPSADGLSLGKATSLLATILPKALLTTALVAAGMGQILSAGAARAAAYNCVPRTSTGPGGFVNLKFTGPGAIGVGDTIACADKTWTVNSFNFAGNTGDIDFEWVEVGPPSGGYTDDLFTTDLHFTPSILGPSTGFFDYTLAIDPTSGFQFDTVQLDSSVGILLGSPGQTTVTKVVTGGPTLISIDGSPVGPIVFNTPSPITVRDTWTVAAEDTLTNVKDSFTQTSKVPGPLPLLGAAAAFGWSRRLRSRVKPVARGQA